MPFPEWYLYHSRNKYRTYWVPIRENIFRSEIQNLAISFLQPRGTIATYSQSVVEVSFRDLKALQSNRAVQDSFPTNWNKYKRIFYFENVEYGNIFWSQCSKHSFYTFYLFDNRLFPPFIAVPQKVLPGLTLCFPSLRILKSVSCKLWDRKNTS